MELRLENKICTLSTKDTDLLGLVAQYCAKQGEPVIIKHDYTNPTLSVPEPKKRPSNRSKRPRWIQEEIDFVMDNDPYNKTAGWFVGQPELSAHTKKAIQSLIYKIKNPKFANDHIIELCSNWERRN
jgi:hypothetical protein